ncbi:hypothetical protein SAMN05444680_116138 [Variovorax sp. YR216]|nr:hypothetical protein SAMN05444680_116138 [Variovorax sp. YR216]
MLHVGNQLRRRTTFGERDRELRCVSLTSCVACGQRHFVSCLRDGQVTDGDECALVPELPEIPDRRSVFGYRGCESLSATDPRLVAPDPEPFPRDDRGRRRCISPVVNEQRRVPRIARPRQVADGCDAGKNGILAGVDLYPLSHGNRRDALMPFRQVDLAGKRCEPSVWTPKSNRPLRGEFVGTHRRVTPGDFFAHHSAVGGGKPCSSRERSSARHGVRMRHAVLERFADGHLQGGGTRAIEQVRAPAQLR